MRFSMHGRVAALSVADRGTVTPRSTVVVMVLVGAMALTGVTALPGTASAYVVRRGDTLSTIASRSGVSTRSLVSANRIADPHHIVAGDVLVIPDGSGGTTSVHHIVTVGETLSHIAEQYGVSVGALARANGITDPDQIRSGTRLSLSAGSSSSSTSVGSSSSGSSPTQTAGSGDASTGRGEVRQLISSAAQRHGWRPAIPLGLAMQESGWNNAVVSSAGARGIMQVLPSTGEWVGARLLDGRTLDLQDPADNIAAGMAYLDYLYNRFDQDVEKALAAYYEGPARVAANGISTGGRRYAANVMALAERYR